MIKLLPLTLMILLPLCAAAQGNWSGEVNADAGSNFHSSPLNRRTHDVGDISAKLGYSSKKFKFDVSGSGSYKHIQTGQSGRDIEISAADTSKSGDVSVKQKTNVKARGGADFFWLPNQYNTFKVYYTFSYDGDTPNNYTLSTGPLGEEHFDYSFSRELGDNYDRTHDAGLSYKRTFDKPGRILSAEAGLVIGQSVTTSEWIKGEGTGDKDGKGVDEEKIAALTGSRYRTTPYSGSRDISASIIFSEPEFAGARNLTLDFSLGYHFKNLEDHSRAATLVGNEWKDSTSYREDFRFRTATLSPALRVRYSTGIYKLDFSYAPEYYAQKLDSEGKVGDINRGTVAHLMNMTNTFTPWQGHLFELAVRRSENRPSYLQICWFPRSGSQYSDELYKGNPELQNSITTFASLKYKYTLKRFSSTLSAEYVFNPRKIEKTYTNEVIDGREYRIYTWVNGGRSRELNAKLGLSWRANNFKADLNGRYTDYHGISLSGSVTHSSDFSVSGSAEYNLKTWTFEASAGYQSDITRSYTSMTAIPTCDAKITKAFGKHISVYLQAFSILDNTVTVTTISEDEKNIREEQIIYNNRLFVLGFSYRF